MKGCPINSNKKTKQLIMPFLNIFIQKLIKGGRFGVYYLSHLFFFTIISLSHSGSVSHSPASSPSLVPSSHTLFMEQALCCSTLQLLLSCFSSLSFALPPSLFLFFLPLSLSHSLFFLYWVFSFRVCFLGRRKKKDTHASFQLWSQDTSLGSIASSGSRSRAYYGSFRLWIEGGSCSLSRAGLSGFGWSDVGPLSGCRERPAGRSAPAQLDHQKTVSCCFPAFCTPAEGMRKPQGKKLGC